MAVHAKQKPSKATSTQTRRQPTTAMPKEQSADQKEHECDVLRGKLSTAETRIAELEKANKEVINRIDWVIDSLHDVLPESR